MPAQAAPQIWIDPAGHAWIDDSGIKVVEVVTAHQAGISAESIQSQLYWLQREQIEAALSYYSDHRAALDLAIAALERRVQALQEEFGESALQKRLRQLKPAR